MKKLGFWLMLALLLINIAAITTIVIHIKSDRKVVEQNRHAFTRVLDSELGFNKKQLEAYNSLNEAFTGKTNDITLEMHEIRSEMINAMNADKPDTILLSQYARQIGDLHFKLKQVTINHMLEVKKMCTPGQKEKLSVLYNNILKCEGPFKGKGQGQGNRWRHRWGQKGNQNQ